MSKVETVSGIRFDVLNPNPDDVRIQDIAWAISRTARFAGHTIPVIPYSVGQHSVAVSVELWNMFSDWKEKDDYGQEVFDHVVDYQFPDEKAKRVRMALHGLLHDAAEAYIGDIPSPVKHLPNLKKSLDDVEDKILESIYKSLNIALPTEQENWFVKRADMIQRTVEAYNFMFSRGSDWGDLPKVSLTKLQEFKGPVASVDAYKSFMNQFEFLMEEYNAKN